MKGMLPSLQEGLGPLPTQEERGQDDAFWTKTKAGGRVLCDTRWRVPKGWHKWESKQEPPPSEAELIDLLKGWFTYVLPLGSHTAEADVLDRYWGMEHDYPGMVLDIRQAKLVPRRHNGPVPLSVQDVRRGDDIGESATDEVNFGLKSNDRQDDIPTRIDNVVVTEEAVEIGDSPSSAVVEPVAGGYDIEETIRVLGDDATMDTISDTTQPIMEDPVAAGAHIKLNDDLSADEVDALAPSTGHLWPVKWQHHMLCVVDPFIRTKVRMLARAHTPNP
jgi:hypothetical protein